MANTGINNDVEFLSNCNLCIKINGVTLCRYAVEIRVILGMFTSTIMSVN